jgi:hypothetical protein
MSARIQHEFHPDADMLSAFAEHALGERERGEVLEHLAVCGRCRQVVALAREAAGAAAATRRHAPARLRIWFRNWGLALIPAAAITAAAVIAIYVYDRDMERNAEVAQVEQQQATEKAPMPPQATPQPQAQAASPVAVGPTAKTAPIKRPSAAPREAVAEPDETASAPAPEAANVPLSSREEPAASPAAEAQAPFVRTQGMIGGAPAPSGTSADEKTESDVAMYDEERKKEAEAEMEARDKHLFAAKATTPAGEHGPGSGTGESSAQVVVTDQQLETQPAPASSDGALMRLRAGAFSAARAVNPVHLPSGLPAISITRAGPRMLAIDKSGALFLSEDSGGTWDEVKRQWTGHAAVVRRRGEEEKNREAAASDISEASEGSSSVAVPHPDPVFELINDHGQVWVSMEGKVWITR